MTWPPRQVMVFDRVPACARTRLQAIVGAMENVENDRDARMLDWERSMLARLCVKGILHDTLYDHEVAARASVERTGPLSEWPTGRGIRLKDAKGEAHLVSVMEDGSRVGRPGPTPCSPMSIRGCCREWHARAER